MTRTIPGACAGLLTIALSGVAAAAGVGSITSEQVAARGVVTSAIVPGELGELDGAFTYQPRLLAIDALNQLRAATTFGALLAPGGVTLNCAASGTLQARVSNSRPRVLKLEWSQCASSQFGSRDVKDGPAELMLPGDSLNPNLLLSMRLGDVNRDFVESIRPEVPQPYSDGQTLYRNLRVTGPLPIIRQYGDSGSFLGRYLVEAKGLMRRVQRLPEFNSAGEPSAEFYDYDYRVGTDGAILTGNYTVDGLNNLTEWGLVAGKVVGQYTYPARPLHPNVRVINKWYRGTGLIAHNRYDNTANEYFHSIDGKVEGDFSQFWNLGCSGPDTFVYRTRQELGQSPYSWFVELYDVGELVINGNTTATFSATGTEPYVDLMGHASVKVQGVGTFNYDYPESVLFGPIYEAARCTP